VTTFNVDTSTLGHRTNRALYFPGTFVNAGSSKFPQVISSYANIGKKYFKYMDAAEAISGIGCTNNTVVMLHLLRLLSIPPDETDSPKPWSFSQFNSGLA
jgi:hypothetical protein